MEQFREKILAQAKRIKENSFSKAEEKYAKIVSILNNAWEKLSDKIFGAVFDISDLKCELLTTKINGLSLKQVLEDRHPGIKATVVKLFQKNNSISCYDRIIADFSKEDLEKIAKLEEISEFEETSKSEETKENKISN